MNIIVAALAGIIVGMVLGIFLLMFIGAVNENVMFLDDDDDEVILVYKDQEGGPMAKPCPTWDGSCNCSPMFSCQVFIPESDL